MVKKPIPLTAFEEFFLLNDRPGSPSTFIIQIRFISPLDKEVSAIAVRKANQNHPLSRCKIEIRRGKPSWVPCEQEPKIQWRNVEPVPGSDVNNFLDITAGPPIQIFGCNGTGSPSATLVFLVHHVAFDGLGFFQWLADWVHAYRTTSGQRTTSPEAVLHADCSITEKEQNRMDRELAKRCRPGLGIWNSIRLLPAQWKSVRAAFQVLKRKAIPLNTPREWQATNQTTPQPQLDCDQSILFLKFDREETSRLSSMARRLGTTVNRLAIRDLFVAINSWQLKNQVDRKGTHFRLMVPVNERTENHGDMTACNHCTIINLDRTPEELSDAEKLLASINRELNVVRIWKLSLNFWRALSVFRRLPGGLAKICNDEVSATALITNVGQPLRGFRLPDSLSGDQGEQAKNSKHQNLELSGYDIMATLSQGVIAAFCLYYFDGCLTISQTFDKQQLKTVEAQELLDQFRDRFELGVELGN